MTPAYATPPPQSPGQVVLQHLRPFAPMEVLNTRVCSKASPAPGNTNFDGCVELLSLQCRARERALTVWDDASFLHIDKAGVCSFLRKQAMLHLSLPTLRFLWKNMRSFTVCGEGQEPPREVARAVIRSVGWGAKQVRVTVARCFFPEMFCCSRFIGTCLVTTDQIATLGACKNNSSSRHSGDNARLQTSFPWRTFSRISSNWFISETVVNPFTTS